METICVRIKIKDGMVKSVREWFQTLKERSDETLESMKNEKVFIESVFLDHQSDENVSLIYYIKAKNLSYAKKIAEKSRLEIDKYHSECKKKCLNLV